MVFDNNIFRVIIIGCVKTKSPKYNGFEDDMMVKYFRLYQKSLSKLVKSSSCDCLRGAGLNHNGDLDFFELFFSIIIKFVDIYFKFVS